MKTAEYCRSEVYSFWDLSEAEQKEVISNYFQNSQEAEEDSFVKLNKEVLPLSMFLRCENSIFNGFYGTSYFSGYFIKFNKFGDEVTVVSKYW